jgi:hypothetical protein
MFLLCAQRQVAMVGRIFDRFQFRTACLDDKLRKDFHVTVNFRFKQNNVHRQFSLQTKVFTHTRPARHAIVQPDSHGSSNARSSPPNQRSKHPDPSRRKHARAIQCFNPAAKKEKVFFAKRSGMRDFPPAHMKMRTGQITANAFCH